MDCKQHYISSNFHIFYASFLLSHPTQVLPVSFFTYYPTPLFTFIFSSPFFQILFILFPASVSLILPVPSSTPYFFFPFSIFFFLSFPIYSLFLSVQLLKIYRATLVRYFIINRRCNTKRWYCILNVQHAENRSGVTICIQKRKKEKK